MNGTDWITQVFGVVQGVMISNTTPTKTLCWPSLIMYLHILTMKITAFDRSETSFLCL